MRVVFDLAIGFAEIDVHTYRTRQTGAGLEASVLVGQTGIVELKELALGICVALASLSHQRLLALSAAKLTQFLLSLYGAHVFGSVLIEDYVN